VDAVKSLVKTAFASLGLTVAKRDMLAEQIPGDYLRSPYLPPIYRQSLARLIYFERMFERIRHVPGDVVECGVSIGTGILNWALLNDLCGSGRHVLGFDSFAGFPPSIEADRKADGAFQTQRGDYASPPELVLKVLEDGRVSPDFIHNNVHLVRGYFDATLPKYDGRIALLHLDCDLYESYQECLEQLYPKVQRGGIIMFDEYEDLTFPGAKPAIDQFFQNKTEKPVRYDEYSYVKYHVVKD
jgi:O-methyltransferase